MEDLKQLMRYNYLKYASYVILDRAIPKVIDGFKPVQRRILHTLWKIHDGKLHKVANVAGQTMAFHPHGDAAIIDALVNMANKNYLLDRQGNFGNLYTGDPAAAARYIETRLSPLAKETLFNPDLTEYVPSYDGRNDEPVCLPAKIPVLLMQGAEGIAVGMSTSILPHNFVELIKAEIAFLEGKEFHILPDFPTGGIMDASNYEIGNGKVKLRSKFEIKDSKTIVIKEICYGTTTESLIRSVDEAAKKGKIKIDSINDYTSSHVEIEIKLPRGQYAQELIDALYAYTDCEVTLNPQIIVIHDNLPWSTDVNEIIKLYATQLKSYLKRELEIEQERLLERIFEKTLEQIFIENRLYKKIEEVKSYDEIHETVEKSLVPYHQKLSRIPNFDDRERLLKIPIRRISKFDIEKNLEDIKALQDQLLQTEKDLKNIKKFTITYLKKLLEKYGKDFPRRTKLQEIKELDFKAIDTKQVKVGFDTVSGFVGTKVSNGDSFECTNYDKVLMLFDDGSYTVTNIPEKKYVNHEGRKLVFVGIADKKTVFNVAYKDPKNHYCYAKRFIVKKFILDKPYQFMEEGMKLEHLSLDQPPVLELQFIPKLRQKMSKAAFEFEKVLVKGVSSKGVRMAQRGVKKVRHKS